MMRPLIDWVLKRFPDTPKKRAKQWITAGRVSVGGAVIRRPDRIIPDPGDGLELLERFSTAAVFDRARIIHPKLTVLYMDSSIAVVDKSAGLLSVPAPKHSGESVLQILRNFLKGGKPPRGRLPSESLPPAFQKLTPLPVHRIDQYTSGVMCVAMNASARKILIEAFSAHRVTREYVAYADGKPKTPTGTWRHTLRLADDGYRQTVDSARDRNPAGAETMEAVTSYEVIREFAIRGRLITKLRLKLFTGCKHQIRIQAAQMGLPLIGDRTYHPLYSGSSQSKTRPPVEFPRQALHAECLELIHPANPNSHMRWTVPLPPDLRSLEDRAC